MRPQQPRRFAPATMVLAVILASATARLRPAVPAVSPNWSRVEAIHPAASAASCFVPSSPRPTGLRRRAASERHRRRRRGVTTGRRLGAPPSVGSRVTLRLDGDDNRGAEDMPSRPERRDRRRFLHRIALFIALGPAVVSWSSFPRSAVAACLPGDTSPSCIGVYKVPIDDKILPYISTPEQLLRFAPDVRWVPPVEYPETYGEALAELGPLRERCEGLKDTVLRGKLEEAGVEMLGITPRVTACGRVIVGGLYDAAGKQAGGTEEVSGRQSKKAEDYSMKAYRVSVALSELEAALGQCDILIGQGLRGELGVSAPAQIQILADLNELNEAFAELLRIVPAVSVTK